jgi:hypothetical protein
VLSWKSCFGELKIVKTRYQHFLPFSAAVSRRRTAASTASAARAPLALGRARWWRRGSALRERRRSPRRRRGPRRGRQHAAFKRRGDAESCHARPRGAANRTKSPSGARAPGSGGGPSRLRKRGPRRLPRRIRHAAWFGGSEAAAGGRRPDGSQRTPHTHHPAPFSPPSATGFLWPGISVQLSAFRPNPSNTL